MLIAQITDLHIRPAGMLAYGCSNTSQFLADAVDELLSLQAKPDVLFITGDLTDCGLPEEYDLVRNYLQPVKMPVYVIPGNHDRRDNMRAAFSDHPYLNIGGGDLMNFVIDDYPVVMIGLDTVVAGQDHGIMDAPRLDWLAVQLEKYKDKPVMIFMHHPPFSTGMYYMDQINCLGGDEMAEIIAKYPNVERVVAGHHHRAVYRRWAGTIGAVIPSVAHQVMFGLEENPQGREIMTMEPPAFSLHQWSADTGVISHQIQIGEFDGPFEFTIDPDYPGYKETPVSE